MEKSNLRNSSSSSKTNSSDNKNKQDGKYYRFPRYKESISPRPDNGRKPNPQRSREAFDKRPRTRSGVVYEKYRNEVVAEAAETGHHSKQGSKKVNLNHLLKFTLAPAQGSCDYSTRRPARSRIKLPKYNKELFLQANCQFVIRDDGTYAPHCTNADLLVDWSLIEEIRLLSHEVPSCPICLYQPYAAKITRCGHIYCWACILHYLSLTDRTWQKCPICFEAIHLTDLKSVVSITREVVTPGTKITLFLMKRERGSLFPVPAWKQGKFSSACRIDDDEAITRYQKLLLASKSDVHDIIKREREHLELQHSLEEEEAEVCFVESALKLLQEREKSLEGTTQDTGENATQPNHNDDSTEDLGSSEIAHNESRDSPYKLPDSFTQNCEISHSYSETGIKAKENPSPAVRASLSADNLNSVNDCTSREKDKSSFCYFYQAADGQHIYLHGLNVRMLVREFGSLEDSPQVIEAKVLSLEKISMTEDIRKRLKYLQHIPLTCEFQVAELHLDHVLSQSTVQEFAEEVEKRQKMRNRKAREERKREKYIEIETNKKLGMYPGATYNLNSCDQFPVCVQQQDKRPASARPNSQASDGSKSEEEGYEAQYPSFGPCGSQVGPSELPSSPPAASFAQLLRDTNNMGQPWHFSSKSPAKPLPVTKTQGINEDDDEEVASVPQYRESFSNAIGIALENAILLSENKHNESDQLISKKKKKAKNKVLFSTTMCRSK